MRFFWLSRENFLWFFHFLSRRLINSSTIGTGPFFISIHKFVVENFPENVFKVKRSVARNFPCNDCPYMDRDRNGLRRHMQRKHTEREGGFECKRVWCLVRMPTLHEIILHMADCKWFCSAPSCSRRGLLRTRDIQDHESFHKAQSYKFGI